MWAPGEPLGGLRDAQRRDDGDWPRPEAEVARRDQILDRLEG